MNGGYDDGYRKCACFWGKEPGALVRRFISELPNIPELTVLDLGCGEGKNAYAFAAAGASVTAVDCSEAALENARRALDHQNITWFLGDASEYLRKSSRSFDVVVMYGLLHCLRSADEISGLVSTALSGTRSGGCHIVVTFNDGPHDLSAHPGFSPILLPHDFFVDLYRGQEVLLEASETIHEAHPNNDIPHFHSITRLVARKRL